MCQVQVDTAVCICPKCKEVYAPVCGTDGLTYASNCYLEQAVCKLHRNVNFGKDGACGLYLLCIFLLELVVYCIWCYSYCVYEHGAKLA